MPYFSYDLKYVPYDHLHPFHPLPTLCLWQPPICSLHQFGGYFEVGGGFFFFFLKILYINEIIRYLLFCDLISLSTHFRVNPYCHKMAKWHLLQLNIPLCMYTTFSLSVQPLVDTGCFHVLAVVTNAVVNMRCEYLFKFVFLFLKYPKVELLGHMVVLFFIIWGLAILFFHSGYTTLHSHQQCTVVHFFPPPHQCLLLLIFLVVAILSVVRWSYGFDLCFPED